ncbi:MAG: hypothetical protein KDB53_14610, partial [Planctomycetes bacterium]|nr:hypothetical protein [Planctomycetota bacterium]
ALRAASLTLDDIDAALQELPRDHPEANKVHQAYATFKLGKASPTAEPTPRPTMTIITCLLIGLIVGFGLGLLVARS